MEFHFMHCCVVQQGILIAIGEKLIRIVYNYCVYYIQHASFFEGYGALNIGSQDSCDHQHLLLFAGLPIRI